MSSSLRILVVEDDADLASIVGRFLESEGFAVRIAPSAEDAYDVLSREAFELLVLDVNLPGDDGFALCRTLRRVSGVPVVFASARAGDDVRALALEGGGDAYLAKPFSLRELLAQINALLRREYGTAAFEDGSAGNGAASADVALCYDAVGRRFFKRGVEVALSPKEFDLAVYLMRHEGVVVSRERLLAEVWGAFSEVEVQTVAVHMSWLRTKLEDDPSRPQHFKTVRGCGYMYEACDERDGQ